MSVHAMPVRKVAAWSVHLLTGTGAVLGLLAIIATAQGNWLAAFAWMAATIVIDSFDGMLARTLRVKQVLPNFDGGLLDNIVDYFTYVIVPAFFLYQAQIVPHGFAMLSAAAITLVLGYQFCQTDAKAEDLYFTGFPSYWNVVVFYLFMLSWPRWVNLAVILLLALGVFVPIWYLYPSRNVVLRKVTLALTVVWGLLLLAVFIVYPEKHKPLIYVSLFYVAFYFGMSFYLTWAGRTRKQEFLAKAQSSQRSQKE